MAQWLAETQLVKNISKQLLLPRQEQYSQDAYRFAMHEHPELKIRHFQAVNSYSERLYAVLVDHKQSQSETCIVFLHGLGSNILEGSLLIEHLPPKMALCCFDFSGSGKSQGKCTTYGIKQHKDIGFILLELQKKGFKKFILWGRSMGAFASLAYTTENSKQNKVCLQILDSPFSNFQQVCKQRARKYFKIPEMLVDSSVNLLRRSMVQQQFNPFDFNLCDRASACTVDTIFIYSEDDQVVPCQSTEQLIKKVGETCVFERLIIKDQHNSLRSAETISCVFQKIRRFMIRGDKQKNTERGFAKRKINVCSSYLKKAGSNKCLSGETDKNERRSGKKMVLFSSLSKQLRVGVKQISPRIKIYMNPQFRNS